MTYTGAHHWGMIKLGGFGVGFFIALTLKGNLFITCLARLTLTELGGF